MRVAAVTAIVAGAGLITVSPANAASVPDAASLRAAITSLNGTGPAAEIELVPGVIYPLPGGAGCDDEEDNQSGDLDVRRTQPLKIFTPDGGAPAVLRMDCDPATSPQRILDVKAPPGMYGAGKLTLRNVIFRNGRAPAGVPNGDGGAVRSVADIVLENTRFENNRAGEGRASTASGVPGERGGSGGAVATFGTVTIDGSAFWANEAAAGAAGFSTSGSCTAVGASDGGPGGAGGAVFAGGGGVITNSTFARNRAANGGAGGNESCAAGETTAGGDGAAGGNGGGGGAIACGTAVIGRTYRCRGDLTVRGSTFVWNSTGAGGAGGNGAVGTSAVGGSGGNGGSGGAIQILGQAGETRTKLTFENSTFDANNTWAGGSGGTAGDNGDGGRGTALYADFDHVSSAPLTVLTHVTMVGGDGGGTLVVQGSPWTATATVIGGGDGPACSSSADNPTFSKSTDDGCGFGAANVHPFSAFALAPLESNGGPTQTRLPGTGSVLLDAVEPLILPTGQHGVSRPQGPRSDIGAVEVNQAPEAGGGSSGAAWPGGGTGPEGTWPGGGTEPEGDWPGGSAGGGSASGSEGSWPGTSTEPSKEPNAEPSTEPRTEPSAASAAPNNSPSPQAISHVDARGDGGGILTQTGFRIGPVAGVGTLLICAGVFVLIRARKPGRHRLNLRLREAA